MNKLKVFEYQLMNSDGEWNRKKRMSAKNKKDAIMFIKQLINRGRWFRVRRKSILLPWTKVRSSKNMELQKIDWQKEYSKQNRRYRRQNRRERRRWRQRQLWMNIKDKFRKRK